MHIEDFSLLDPRSLISEKRNRLGCALFSKTKQEAQRETMHDRDDFTVKVQRLGLGEGKVYVAHEMASTL